MPLPVLNVPYYETVLPCSGEKVKYRPFLVKEEKILLVAAEDGQHSTISKALVDVVDACTDGVDASSLPVSDLEYLFLQIRIKAVGEIVEANIPCQECGETTTIKLDLTKVKINKQKDIEYDIVLDGEVGVRLKYPDINIIMKNSSEGEIDAGSSFNVVADCVEYIFDKDKIYSSSDHSRDEIMAFLDSLSQQQFEKITEFFSNSPTMTYEVNYTCPHCKAKNKLKLEGIQDFFEYASVT